MRLLLLLLALVALPNVALACGEPAGYVRKSFTDELSSAAHVVIVRVESQQLTDQGAPGAPFRSVISNVRVVDTLLGAPVALQRILYNSSWCGGHRLDVGGYYVAVIPQDLSQLELSYASQLLIGLGDEYSELVGYNEDSSLLMFLRNFSKGASIPSAFNLEPYLELVRMPVQMPSVEAEGR